jgi:hypothetical protein
MRKLLVVALCCCAVAPLSAQAPAIRPEVRPFVGLYTPTGAQRDLFKDAAVLGLQAALEVRPTMHLVGTFGWMESETKFGAVENDVQMLQYDIGAEIGLRQAWGAWEFKPFVGLGGGARTYLYKADAFKDRTCSVGYAALGAELQLGRAAMRLEGRDNVFCYRAPLAGAKNQTRNDIGVSLGLAYHIR